MDKNTENILLDRNLFLIGDNPNAEHHIVYAPLADSAFVASREDIESLAMAAENNSEADPAYAETLKSLADVEPVNERQGYIHDEHDFINLSILPNNICNFSCSYCYSAKGRSSVQMDFPTAKAAIDYFFNIKRPVPPQLLTFSIFGGGEPMISWGKVVKPAIEYIYSYQVPGSPKIVVTIITNGSMIHDEFIGICREYNIDLVVSFDILEDVQNAQRRHYDVVSSNIRKLISNNVIPAINSVVTDINVDRQVEMIEILHSKFPEIRYVAFEPVIGEVGDKAEFYKKLANGFVAALHRAEDYGIKLTCTTLRNLDVTVDRYCAGEFALCPDGSISICPCVTSNQEENYHKYVYGKVENGTVIINHQKLKDLLAVNVHTNEWCRDCFAKWNCGGGCMNTNDVNGGMPDKDYCNFTRVFTRHFMFQRLKKTYSTEYNEDLTQYINPDEYIIK